MPSVANVPSDNATGLVERQYMANSATRSSKVGISCAFS
jgi:hypothetical protein